MTGTDPTPPTLYAVLSAGDDCVVVDQAAALELATALAEDDDASYRAYRLVPLDGPPQPADLRAERAILRWAADRAEAHGVPYASVTDLRRWADELEQLEKAAKETTHA